MESTWETPYFEYIGPINETNKALASMHPNTGARSVHSHRLTSRSSDAIEVTFETSTTRRSASVWSRTNDPNLVGAAAWLESQG